MDEATNFNLVRCVFLMQMDEATNFNLVRCSNRKMLKTCAVFDSLPDELLMQILLHIPAQDIFDATLFVCWRWFHIIKTHNFTLAHLNHSTSGLLIKHIFKTENSFMSMTRAGQIEISAFTYNSRHQFWSSCNGLLLGLDFRDEYELIITNPITKQHLALPPFITRTTLPYFQSAIAFVATHMEYKVVRMFWKGIQHPQSWLYCGVLTVGADNSWRLVDTQHLSFAASRLLDMCPLVTGGFVHWAQDHHNNHLLTLNKVKGFITTPMRNNYILTMNMETEIITHCLAPQWSGGYYYYKYFSGGNFLSLMIGRSLLKWEVWEMKPETREWTKLPDIDLEAHKALLNQSYDREEGVFKPDDNACLDCKLAPAGWLKYREVIIFIVYRPVKSGGFNQARLRVAYNVQTQDISVFDFEYNAHPYLVHTNSLIGIR